MKKKVMVMVMAAAMAAAMTACGGSKSATADTTAAAADTTAADTAAESKADDTTAAADTSDKTWVIATDTAFKPFEYTDERKSSGWIFSDGYYDANQSMAVAENSDIAGFDDLNGKKVAVKTASMSADYAESIKDQYGFEITYFEDSPTMYQAVVGGQVAACFDDTPIMASNIKDTGIAMKLVDGTGNDPAEYGFAIFDDSKQELIDMFNAGLKDIKDNGTYDEIIAKYLGE